MIPARAICIGALALIPSAPWADTLNLPASAVLAYETTSQSVPSRFPVGPFRDGAVPFAEVDRSMHSQVWRIREASRTTSQAALEIRGDLAAAGYEILLDCKDIDCGGFDFRYALGLVKEPVMHVDLGDFRNITAWKAGTEEYLSVMISRGPTGLFLQVDVTGEAVTSSTMPPPDTVAGAAPEATPAGTAPGDVAEALLSQGWMTLDDLSFETGSAELTEGLYPSLKRLAAYLTAHPDVQVAIVGHTDAQGTLAANVALSHKRATSVVKRLVEAYGVAGQQLDAEGAGYLAPRWSNMTEEGRKKNRRVEVVLTSTP